MNRRVKLEEKLQSVRCSPVVFSINVLAARKINLMTARVRKKKMQCSRARKCSQRPFDTPPWDQA